MFTMENFSFPHLLGDLVKNPQSAVVIICAILLACLMGWIKTPMTTSLEILEKTVTVLQSHDLNTQRANTERLNATLYQNMLLRSICRNQAPLQSQGTCEPRYQGYEEK